MLNMIFQGRYLDEILRKLYLALSKSSDTFTAGKGPGRDLLAPTVILKDPRSRISATATRGRLISALAEFCWYMSGSADIGVMRYYLPKYPPVKATGMLEEAYGPRLIGNGEFGYNVNQIERIVERLRKKPDTRRAVISLLEACDLEHSREEAPCTVALQFICRRGRLHMVAMMRSNDAVLGFTHDVFCFTMIQELIARALGVEVGEYHHFATSLHLYDSDVEKALMYLAEGHQSPTFAMPKMPNGCQFENLKVFLDIESRIRIGEITLSEQINLPPYWKDLAIVLLRHADGKMRRGTSVLEQNFSHIHSPFYKNFFIKKPNILTSVIQGAARQEAFNLSETQND